MAKTTEKYELMYIINPNLSEEETAAVVEKFKALVEQNGTLEEMEEMGKRKLAYETARKVWIPAFPFVPAEVLGRFL